MGQVRCHRAPQCTVSGASGLVWTADGLKACSILLRDTSEEG